MLARSVSLCSCVKSAPPVEMLRGDDLDLTKSDFTALLIETLLEEAVDLEFLDVAEDLEDPDRLEAPDWTEATDLEADRDDLGTETRLSPDVMDDASSASSSRTGPLVSLVALLIRASVESVMMRWVMLGPLANSSGMSAIMWFLRALDAR
mmetsp:Transcript_12108/g.26235  ORF Transcript_12108/g.26235 Transcript_12108/m.26235 type:complete len:151 (-) Transcript_12108:234-686(-)